MLGLNYALGVGRIPLLGPAVAGGAPPYTADSVLFDGTNDFLTRGGALTGATDNDTILISFWFDLTGGDGANERIFQGPNIGDGLLLLRRLPANTLVFSFRSPTGVKIWEATTVDTFLAAGGWVHFLMALDQSATKRLLFINDAAASITGELTNAGNIDFTLDDLAIGAEVGGTNPLTAEMADFYLTNEFLDIGVEANRRKFIDAAGKPVDLGTGGITPTGTAALIFFSGPTVDWHTNKGSGGGFTESGALTDGATSPSD